jgi:glycosyltransferase involved in cell wall biosynthesis
MPAVSIIMPCHNAAKHLPNSFGSVFSQTRADWELIAVDDGSTDATLATLQGMNDPRIYVLTQANQGPAAARNAGISKARGRYVAFLDADDTWHSDFLAHMLAALETEPDAVLAYCGWQKLGLPDKQGLPFVPPDYETPFKLETLFTGCRWPIHAALTRREAVLAAKGFDPSLINAEDFALWLRIATVAPIVRVAEVLAYYHFHGDGQVSAVKGRAALHHLRAQQQFLADYPRAAERLGKRARELMLRTLLERGYMCYWRRDLPAARQIFRMVMRQGYGTLTDWKYMLPAWLPLSWHRRLIHLRDATDQSTDG